MLPHTRLEHQFVHYIPDRLEPGVIYISMDYATAAHSCCCGCGEQVVTPFTPTDWKFTFDGETVSLSPSVGNWNFACRSHYYIERSRVIEARPWREKEIETGRWMDASAKASYYGKTKPIDPRHPLSPSDGSAGLWTLIKRRMRRRKR